MKLRRGTTKKPLLLQRDGNRAERAHGRALSSVRSTTGFLAAKTEPLTPLHRVGFLKRIPHSLLWLAQKLIEKICGKLRKGRGREAAAFPKGYGGISLYIHFPPLRLSPLAHFVPLLLCGAKFWSHVCPYSSPSLPPALHSECYS